MPPKRQRIRTKRLRDLYKAAAESIPGWEDVFESSVKQILEHYSPSQHGINASVNNLRAVIRKFGKQGVINIVRFVQETGFWLVDLSDVMFWAKAYDEAKTDLIQRTLGLYQIHPMMFRADDFKYLFAGIEKFGEEDLESGIALTPRPSDTAEGRVRQDCWDVERVWRRRKRDYALVTASLGYLHVKRLFDNFKAEGMSDLTILSLLIRHIVGSDPAGSERLVFRSISLIKTAGLPVAKWTETVRNTLERRYGSPAEVLVILQLIKEAGIRSSSNQDLGLALKYYRQPLKRHLVIEAARAKNLNQLALERIGEGLGLGLAWNLGTEEEKSAIERELIGEAHLNTTIATVELLSACEEYGHLTGRQIYAIARLARNKLLLDQFLRDTAPNSKTLPIVDAVFGAETRGAFTRIRREFRYHYAVGLLRSFDPSKLDSLLASIGKKSRCEVIAAVSTYDLATVITAIDMLRSEGKSLENRVMQATRRLIFGHSTAVSKPIRWENQILGVHDEVIELLCYMQLPYQLRLNIGRLIRKYRHAYALMLQRIATDHAYR